MGKTRNEDYIKAFGENLRKLRTDRELSQYKLADMADIDRSQVIDIENGEINTTISTVYALAVALEIEPKVMLDF
jgi:transcriptional regulator with XRE-family HTH domain